MNKQNWLDIAEIIDAHRIWPKSFMVIFIVAYLWFAYDSYIWVKSMVDVTDLDNIKEIPTSVVAFVGATLTALGGVLTLAINKYFDTGRKWSKRNEDI